MEGAPPSKFASSPQVPFGADLSVRGKVCKFALATIGAKSNLRNSLTVSDSQSTFWGKCRISTTNFCKSLKHGQCQFKARSKTPEPCCSDRSAWSSVLVVLQPIFCAPRAATPPVAVLYKLEQPRFAPRWNIHMGSPTPSEVRRGFNRNTNPETLCPARDITHRRCGGIWSNACISQPEICGSP